MNPDYYKNSNSETSTVWTISKGPSTIMFKMISGSDTILIITNDSSRSYAVETARKIWDDYIRRGFRVVNECKNHNMKNFHDAKRKEERNKEVMKSIHSSMEDFVKSYQKQYAKEVYKEDIHDMEWKEARTNPKKKCYTDNWEYA